MCYFIGHMYVHVLIICLLIWLCFPGVFGTSLEETIVNESDTETKEIPAVVELCVSYIREHGLMEEGIFR